MISNLCAGLSLCVAELRVTLMNSEGAGRHQNIKTRGLPTGHLRSDQYRRRGERGGGRGRNYNDSDGYLWRRREYRGVC